MPANFLSVLYYTLAVALGLALIVTLVAFGATIFALAFIYIFIPLFLVAFVRWLWLKYKFKKQGYIIYNDKK